MVVSISSTVTAQKHTNVLTVYTSNDPNRSSTGVLNGASRSLISLSADLFASELLLLFSLFDRSQEESLLGAKDESLAILVFRPSKLINQRRN
jgi:hypothetical protein